MAKKYRAEIISNQSVEDDIIERLETEIPDIEYTLMNDVHGKGHTTKKLGSAAWPEQNFVLISYVEKEAALKVKEIIASVKKKFPKEGISLFFTKCAKLES
jgi:hypothetical protein